MASHHWRQPDTETGAIDLLLGRMKEKGRRRRKSRWSRKGGPNTISRLG